MQIPSLISNTKCMCASLFHARILNQSSAFARWYAKKTDDGCRKAIVDLPPDTDPNCPVPCERSAKKKESILHRIKLKIIEGGTNFGTPFRRVQCTPPTSKEAKQETKALPAPAKVLPAIPAPRAGVQVSVLGADTTVGQYVALLLKQCPCIKKLRLYDATHECCQTQAYRNLCNVVEDLKHIDTNCKVQAFSCACLELEKCLQNSDIVLMLESAYVDANMPPDKRFYYQAPLIKKYTDAIATECPRAFVVVCATPIECMVPLVAETLKETGWYDHRKVLGSLAVPEMRASTLAARALCLEPRYTRVPCVGGTEGKALVPLFSKAVEYFEFAEHNAEMMTQAIRSVSEAVTRKDGDINKAADLSEAHALAGLVNKVAWALLCKDVPTVTGFVEAVPGEVISPCKFIANTVELAGMGISRNFGLPKMNEDETEAVHLALNQLCASLVMALDWHCNYFRSIGRLDACQYEFFTPTYCKRLDDCAYAAT